MESATKVLIVDDEDSNVDMLSRRLSRCGYEVISADNGEQALRMLKDSRVDLVLLDQMMPGMTGTEVLRKIRMTKSAQQLPVIMVTAVSDSSAIALALDLGANDYVTKPLDFQIALARIRTQLAMGREEDKVRRNEERHVLAARGSGEGLWDWDLANNTVFCTAELHSLVGLAAREKAYPPRSCLACVHPKDRRAVALAFANPIGQSETTQAAGGSGDDPLDESASQFRFRHASGRYRWFSLRGVTLRNPAGVPIRRVGSITDVTARLTIDTLTGLANKRLLEEEIETAILRQKHDPLSKFCVLLFDIDHFKHLRPSLTQGASQFLLIRFAERVQKVLSESGGPELANSANPPLLARLAEDEFAILLDRLTDVPHAESLAENLTRAMLPSFSIEEREVFCSISLGLVIGDPSHASAEDVLRDADTAKSAAELRGVGRWVLFEESMRKLRDQRLQLDIDLRTAVKKQEFEVFYQSRVHLDTGAICGFEALVRWNHPTRGQVSPLEFIPIAEESGIIHDIGLWVLEKACEQTQLWRQQFDLADDFEVSVNLSPQQCKEPNLVSSVREILRRTGLPASSLNLELTESLLMEDIDQAKGVLQALKRLGIGLKIDDFGTGYSCLKYLCQFPFDSLKIDRSFTKELDQDSVEIEEIVRTIVQMAGNLKMEVVAEGVENAAHVSRLRELGCKYGQGFLFSRPVNAATAERMLGPRRVQENHRIGGAVIAAVHSSREKPI
ncbi:putative bifunctional diguanylate cyclase/phosphodiesterase [Granulicella aggregans]|jgi:diguanylate cyclase (GGDEF)-like protein|uniref:putative bifunctional diguanylate cyclase/phosphodiesterase n=1 Tax=Granulicella aggregans TaxID=474949 RepID=UPI0021DF4ACE|nr:EAL domain-containing protein [Granulicella aggregans]